MSNLGGNVMRKLNKAVLVSLTAIFGLIFTAFAAAQTTVSATSVNFGNVVVNTTSAAKVVSLKNTGASSISVSSLSVTGGTPYAIGSSSTCLNPTLAAGKSCTVLLTLSPTSVGAQPAGTLTITTTAPNSPQTVALSGSGVAATALASTVLHFNNVVVGATSAVLTDTLYNNQSTALAISSLVPSGAGFAVGSSTTCGSTLAAYSNCKIAMTFTPTAAGAVTGSVTVNTDAANSPLIISLSGTGVAPVGLNPSSLSFGNQPIGTISAARTLTLTNNQASSLTITQALFGGPFVLDTGAMTTCPVSGGTVSGSLAAGASCVIGVDFKPVAVGATTGGQITVIDSAASSPQIAILAGIGVPPVHLSTTGIGFGNVLVGTTSTTQTVTVANNQTVSLNFSSIAVSAPYAIVSGSTTCLVGTPLAAGGNCVIGVLYSPTVAGATPASSLTISDDAPSSPQLVSLSGKGVMAVTLNPAALNFGTVIVNTATVENFTLTNNLSTPLIITSLTGLPAAYSLNGAGTTCPLSPATVPAGGSCVISVSLTATAKGAQPGTLSINDNAPGSPQTIALSASAVLPARVTPSSLSFTGQWVGTTSAAQTITLTNQQSTPLLISGATITGANSGDFSISASSCPYSPATLPVGAQCTLQVTFTPSGPGTRTATLSINDPMPIPLTGTGNAPVTVLPGLLSFAAPVGTTSKYQTVTIKNASTGSVQFTSLQLSGPFVQTSTSCGTLPFTLASGASCAVTLSFNPTVGGVGDGQLQVYETAGDEPAGDQPDRQRNLPADQSAFGALVQRPNGGHGQRRQDRSADES